MAYREFSMFASGKLNEEIVFDLNSANHSPLYLLEGETKFVIALKNIISHWSFLNVDQGFHDLVRTVKVDSSGDAIKREIRDFYLPPAYYSITELGQAIANLVHDKEEDASKLGEGKEMTIESDALGRLTLAPRGFSLQTGGGGVRNVTNLLGFPADPPFDVPDGQVTKSKFAGNLNGFEHLCLICYELRNGMVCNNKNEPFRKYLSVWYPSANPGYFFSYEPKYLTFLDLSPQILEQLRFRVVDQNCRPVSSIDDFVYLELVIRAL